MARQLILCCDGTNNNLTGRTRDTNVAKLAELLAPDRQNQVLYYDPGVGNVGELPEATLWDKGWQKLERIYSLAYGKGIYENIAQAYLFLMRNWQPDDQIFLYGFSRGAFTARSVGGLVTQFGILRPEMEAMVPTLLHVYFSDRDKHKDNYESIKNQINQLFTNDAARSAPVWFVGVWDTVESVGAPLLRRKITAVPTIVNKRFSHVRQALALDEYRHSFAPRHYFIEKGYDYAEHNQSIQQQWFSGAHSDVGGGMPNSAAGLSQQAFLWMAQESAHCALRLRAEVLNAQGQLDPAQVTAWLDRRAEPTPHAAPHKVVNDQLYLTPWWALGGMCVRDPRKPQHQAAQRAITALPPVESPTVQANALHYPSQTLWRQARSLRWLLLALVLAGTLWAIAGALLLPGTDLQGTNLRAQLQSALDMMPSVAAANCQFAQWQLGWLLQGQAPTAGLKAFTHPAGAVLVDFGLIAAYGYLLARATGWAFTRIAGLRRVSQTAPVWLNYLGMAALVTIGGDIAENLFTWALILTSPNPYVPSVEWLLGAWMSLAAMAKWLGLTGSAALVAWACVTRPRKAQRDTQELHELSF
jgi:uncharacterized protein (DUF2235 family)